MSVYPVTPELFASENVPERLMGFELEYEAQTPIKTRTNAKVITIGEESGLPELMEGGSTLRTAGLPYYRCNGKYNLINGAQLHPDVDHMEYSGQECLGPEELSASVEASGIIMEWLVRASGKLIHIYQRTGSVNPVDGHITTKGFHLNYLTPNSTIGSLKNDELSNNWLASVLGTQYFAWNGMVTREGFIASQKSPHIVGDAIDIGKIRATGASKPMVRAYAANNDRTTNVNHGFGRIEDMSKDISNPWALFTASGETSVALRMIEHPKGRKFLKDIEDNLLIAPSWAMYDASRDLSLTKQLPTLDGSHNSVVYLQDRYADAMLEFSSQVDLPEDEQRSLTELREVVDDTRKAIEMGDTGALVDRIGFIAKHRGLQRRVKGPLISSNLDALMLCVEWDLRVPEGIGRQAFSKRGRDVVDPAIIGQMTLGTNMRTRAAIRSSLISKNISEVIDLKGLTWRKATYVLDGGYGRPRSYSLHPYETILDETRRSDFTYYE